MHIVLKNKCIKQISEKTINFTKKAISSLLRDGFFI